MLTKKKHIGVDIDNVVAETFRIVVEKFNLFFNRSISYEELDEWDYLYSKSGIPKKDIDKFLSAFFQDIDHVRIVKPVKNAGRILNRLRQSGRTISYITARPCVFEKATLSWLEKHSLYAKKDNLEHYPRNDFQISDAAYKLEKTRKHGVEVMIEDSLEIAEHLDIPVLLFDRPWNRKKTLGKNISRVFSWTQIEEMLL